MPEPGRRPLKPLPQQLGGPVREFTEQLRTVYEDRTELNQRELAAALHLTKSPVSRYLNGQEVIPAGTFAALCDLAGLSPRERQRLGRLREQAAAAAEQAKHAAQRATSVRTDAAAGARRGAPAVAGADPRTDAPADVPTDVPANARARARTHARRETPPGALPGGTPGALPGGAPGVRRYPLRSLPAKLLTPAKLRTPAALGALAAVVALGAGAFALSGPYAPGRPGERPANMTADEPRSSPSCRTTRVYRVIEDGDILDAERNDIGDVHADDVFRLDAAPPGRPYRFRDYGHVAGSRTKGYVDQAKLKALGSRCVQEEGQPY